MATYLELKQQAAQLLQQAEQLRQQEISKAVADIKAKMAEYGISIADLQGGRQASAKPRTAAAAPAKYRGPNGETWSGGRGRKPKWVMDALAAGKKIEDFAI